MKWKPAIWAPHDHTWLAIAATITCPCAKGARVVLMGARIKGEWVLQAENFEHAFEITHFLELPQPPAGGVGAHHHEGHA